MKHCQNNNKSVANCTSDGFVDCMIFPFILFEVKFHHKVSFVKRVFFFKYYIYTKPLNENTINRMFNVRIKYQSRSTL